MGHGDVQVPISDSWGNVEPVWAICECGARSTIVPCWECAAKQREIVEADEAWEDACESIPQRYRGAFIRDPKYRKLVQVRDIDATVHAVTHSRSVTFTGKSGTGKSTLAVMCLRERRPKSALFVDAGDLEEARARQQFGRASELQDRAERVDLLVLDELDGKRAALGAVWDCIKARHNANLCTFVTTGLSPTQIAAMYGDGCVRRLFEPSCALAVLLGGQQ
jgi:ATP:corrinoid adenosyltransferase